MHIVQEKKRENAILVGVVHKDQIYEQVEEYLEELELLTDTAGADVLSKEIQERKEIDPAFFIGKGKADMLGELAKEIGATVIIFDDELSPAQTRNLEKRCDVKIIDRNALILDIFASRAKTREAKTQVELAQLEYMLPRLTRMWTHLSRQAGGAGIGLRGPGEKQLEVDRRLIQKRITHLKTDLEKIERQRHNRRRQRQDAFKVALMGYTNVGKSTLMNALTQSDVFVENRLFATLDSTVRRMNVSNGIEILLIDTVGFIRKLPHHLVASFKSTLEETQEADLLLHVIDISSQNFRDQIHTVQNVMKDLNIDRKSVLNVFNKVDRISDRELISLVKDEYAPAITVSAYRGIFLDKLRQEIVRFATENFIEMNVKLNIQRQKEIASLYEMANVLDKKYDDGYVNLRLRINKSRLSQIENIIE